MQGLLCSPTWAAGRLWSRCCSATIFVCSRLDEPGTYGALVHLDLNPTNALVTDDAVRLVDFEGAGFGHIGFDASFLHYPFPDHSPNWSVLPDHIVQAADRAYREALPAPPSPVPLGDRSHYRHLQPLGRRHHASPAGIHSLQNRKDPLVTRRCPGRSALVVSRLSGNKSAPGDRDVPESEASAINLLTEDG
jgi:hypothetical protein